MSRKTRLFAAIAVVALLVAPGAGANPIANHLAAVAGGNRLVDVQFENGTFPWLVGAPFCTEISPCQNVQGVTALGLIDAYRVSLDQKYLDAAGKTQDWLEGYAATGPCQSSPPADTPPCRLSSSSIYFLAQYAMITLSPADLAVARTAMAEAVEVRGGGAELVDFLIDVRDDQGNGNLGLWDAALFVKAAQDLGQVDLADEMALALASQDRVDEQDSDATYYEIGLAGMIIGLSEADFLGHLALESGLATALKATQATDGSFPVTYAGTDYPGDTQTTAYAVLALTSIGEIASAQSGADFIRTAQRGDGGFNACMPSTEPGCSDEYAEVDAEATSALAWATLVVPKGPLNYADAVTGLV